jgi:hypothetical protein
MCKEEYAVCVKRITPVVVIDGQIVVGNTTEYWAYHQHVPKSRRRVAEFHSKLDGIIHLTEGLGRSV